MRTLERIAAWTFGLAFLALGLAVAVETVMRKAFNRSLQGVDELGGYVLAVGAALAFAVALIARAHIRIDVLHERLPRWLRIILNLLALPALAASAAAVLAMALHALSDTIAFSATAQTPWATPLKLPQGAWVAALGVFAAVALLETLALLRLLVRGDLAAIDRRHGPRGAKEELADELADVAARNAAGGGRPSGASPP
jgi:TRAP-type C4-dicarboxylate transport system permease small subunit